MQGARPCGRITLVVRWLRLPLALALGLGLVLAPGAADAQLWKPTKKKPAAASKAKSAPTPSRKVSKPTKRKPRPKKARPSAKPAPRTPEFDDAPIITIEDGNDEE
jgi:hypothetical protein